MFDIGFFELVLIGVVGLLILGPERLPGAIRTMGLWIGRLRRSFNTIKADIEREVGADEIRRQLRNEEIMAKIKSTRTQFKESVDSVKKQAEAVKQDLSLEKELSGLPGLSDKEKAGKEAGATPEAAAEKAGGNPDSDGGIAKASPPPDMKPAASSPGATEPPHSAEQEQAAFSAGRGNEASPEDSPPAADSIPDHQERNTVERK